MRHLTEIQKRPAYTKLNGVTKSGGVYIDRTPLAKELHTLICELALRSGSNEEAEAADIKIREFLKEGGKASTQPSIMLEESINNCSHIVDALHLPFSNDIECGHDLRVAKAQVLFSNLAEFCRREATKSTEQEKTGANDLTWEKYAHLLTHPNNDGFRPLMEAINSGDLQLYEDVVAELTHLRGMKVIDDATYAQQFTSEATGQHTPLAIAARSGNKEIYDRVAAELFQLNRHKHIDDATYTRQFIQDPTHPYSPLFYATKSNNTGIYLSVSRKISQLHKKKLISDETFANQFTQPTSDGFTPLQEAIFSGNKEMFTFFVADMKEALRITSPSHEEYLTKFRAQLDSVVTRYSPRERGIEFGRRRGMMQYFWHSVWQCPASA